MILSILNVRAARKLIYQVGNTAREEHNRLIKMSIERNQSHRPGPFKQTNKPHKHGRHRSKGSISATNKGKISIKNLSKQNKKNLNKLGRRNRAMQIRQNKRDEVLSKKRSLGCYSNAPFLVCLLPLNKQVDGDGVLSYLTKCDEEASIFQSSTGCIHMSVPCLKQRFSFVRPNLNNDLEILDTLKVCDTVLFIISAAAGFEFGNDVIDDWGCSILLSSFAQGLPTPTVVVTEFEGIHVKKKIEHKRHIQKLVSKWMPNEKISILNTKMDALNVLRKIGSQKSKSVTNRDRRPHIYAEDYEYIENMTGTSGTLKITGYLRGTTLSVNDLVHLPGLGDFQMSQIDSPDEPFNTINETSTTTRILERCDPLQQESLESENCINLLDAEQTWPTEEELETANSLRKNGKTKKIPKGWSDYQAAWIPEDDVESVSSDGNEDFNYAYADSEEEDVNVDDIIDTLTEPEGVFLDKNYDAQLDWNKEAEELEQLKAANNDKHFPDEMDTPLNIPAHTRFQKYRGLESFRTSPWDTKENLPPDYGRIFQFKKFVHTKNRITKSLENKKGVSPGWYVTIYVENISKHLWTNFEQTKAPLIVIGLLPHEHKMSILNVTLKRTSSYEMPIKSKERLIFQCGYRKFIVCPIFNQHTNGNKHKYERYFQPNSTSVATFYAPIQFPPSPILCFKEIGNKLVLVATGNMLSCNPDRLIIKRIVLSGHPFKINKNHAVIRFMFFNREDIIYFKPIKLRSKYGRIGHIKEPLGTHGHMKCVFDGQLKSMDTVTLNLYKRIFPKWTYEECIVRCTPNELTKMECNP